MSVGREIQILKDEVHRLKVEKAGLDLAVLANQVFIDNLRERMGLISQQRDAYETALEKIAKMDGAEAEQCAAETARKALWIDYWNDPPECDEGPECPECGEIAECDEETGEATCECGHRWTVPEETYGPEDFVGAEPCPHGKPPNEYCDACAALSDHAYDAAREDRHFGRTR